MHYINNFERNYESHSKNSFERISVTFFFIGIYLIQKLKREASQFNIDKLMAILLFKNKLLTD